MLRQSLSKKARAFVLVRSIEPSDFFSLSLAAAAAVSLHPRPHLEPRRRLGVVLDHERLADEAEGVESVGCHAFLF